MIDRRAMSDGCRPVLERLGATFGPETIVGTLSIAEQQLVEIARALHAKSKILVLDEPTTALSSRETERLFALIRQLRDEGIAIIYISHRMAEVYELSDRVSVLRDGTYVGTLDKRRDQRRGAGQDDGRPRPLHLLQEGARPARQPRAGRCFEVEGVTDGGRRVQPCQLHSCTQGEVLGHRRAGRLRAAPSWRG